MQLTKKKIWTGVAGIAAATMVLLPAPGSAHSTDKTKSDPVAPLTTNAPAGLAPAVLPAGVTPSVFPPPGCKFKPAHHNKHKTKPSRLICK
jgi:hypothetical protein